LTIALVAVTGLAAGSLRIRGIGLGPAGVLFAGLIFGQLGASIDHEIAEFTKEFGLILFVFTIGLQLGPGIIQLWKKQGLLLNGMAVAIVAQGTLLVIFFMWLLELSPLSAAGLFSGATTNTPSLGAAEQAAAIVGKNNPEANGIETLTAAYAVAYPGGIIGIIAAMMLIRRLLKIDLQHEAQQLREQEHADHEPIIRRCLIIDNPNLTSTAFGEIPGIEETGVRISRIQRAGEDRVHGATESTTLAVNDVVLIVGPKSGIERFTPVLGRATDRDLMQTSGSVEFRRIFVTEALVLGRSLRELALDKLFNATVTRINRAGVEVTPRGSSSFHYGDVVHAVGEKDSLDRLSGFLGNSTKSLKETPFSPLFVGIAVGVAAGLVPFYLPGVPFPVRLGLAGGPLIAAIVFSLIGSIGKFVWYIPDSANLALRELGIILFLACAGLGAGPSFFDAVTSLQGMQWMISGIAITMIPLLTTGILARVLWKKNFITICGVLAGSMTDPPALAFANSFCNSDGSSTAYAAVYPLTMIARILAAQAIVLMFS
jgi:putative transport protein